MDVFTRIPGCGLEIWHGVGTPARERLDRFLESLRRFPASRSNS